MTGKLLANDKYPYVQGDFDGGGMTEIMMQQVLLKQLETKGGPESDLKDYLGSIRIAYADEQGEPAALSVSWVRDDPSTMAICIITGLDKEPQNRSCSLLVSDSVLQTMKEIPMYDVVSQTIDKVPSIPDEHLGAQLDAEIDNLGLSNHLHNLLKGKTIHLPVVVANRNGESYTQGHVSKEDHQMNFGDKPLKIKPDTEFLGPAASAIDLMMKTLLSIIRPENKPTIGCLANEDDLEHIEGIGYISFLDQAILTLEKAMPPPKPSLMASISERYHNWKTAGVTDTINQLRELIVQLQAQKIKPQEASEKANQLFTRIETNASLGSLAKEYKADLQLLAKASEQMRETNQEAFAGPRPGLGAGHNF